MQRAGSAAVAASRGARSAYPFSPRYRRRRRQHRLRREPRLPGPMRVCGDSRGARMIAATTRRKEGLAAAFAPQLAKKSANWRENNQAAMVCQPPLGDGISASVQIVPRHRDLSPRTMTRPIVHEGRRKPRFSTAVRWEFQDGRIQRYLKNLGASTCPAQKCGKGAEKAESNAACAAVERTASFASSRCNRHEPAAPPRSRTAHALGRTGAGPRHPPPNSMRVSAVASRPAQADADHPRTAMAD
jgi:hypothetical protein